MKANLQKWRGLVVLSGESINSIANKYLHSQKTESEIPEIAKVHRLERDGSENFHITVLNSFETDMVEDINSILSLPEFDLFDVGMGRASNSSTETWFVVICCPQADTLRNKLGLAQKDLHITLGFNENDLHDVSKGLCTLLNPILPLISLVQIADFLCKMPLEEVSAWPQFPTFLKFVTIQLMEADNFEGAALRQITKCALSAKCFEVAEISGHFLLDKGYIFGLASLITCAKQQSCDFHADILLSRLPFSIVQPPDPSIVHRVLSNFNRQLLKTDRQKHPAVVGIVETTGILDLFTLPRNFGWVIENKLGGCAIPNKVEHIIALEGIGISTIVTLHESPLSVELSAVANSKRISTHHFYVEDRTPPTIDQLHQICELVKNASGGCVLHCQGGVGRTATALIAFLMCNEKLSASVATAKVTAVRKVLLTISQSSQLQTWWKTINMDFDEKNSVNNPVPQLAQTPTVKLPPLILLCGLPASGKSTFAQSLVQAFNEAVVRVNKDEMRQKGETESLLYDGIKKEKTVIVDCCNVSIKKRRDWMDLAFNPRTWCIHFDLSVEECGYRIRRRQNHPTIPPGEGGIRIIRSMLRQYEPPTACENFEQLFVIRNEDEANSLLDSWGVQPIIPTVDAETETLIKFPRTAHAINIGGATRDDKILLSSELSAFLGPEKHIVIEEKLDGANMGFFFDRNGVLKAQNRSHFVDSEYHAQFKPLSKWMFKHTADLWEVLEAEHHPGRFILYGEWMHATHSVKYTRLPGWFVAFDLYDKYLGHFLSRNALAAKLVQTCIPQVPLLHKGFVVDIHELEAFVNGPSRFSDSPREGIIIRLVDELDGKLLSRAKIVRENFIAGNERWNNTAKLEVNELNYSKEN